MKKPTAQELRDAHAILHALVEDATKANVITELGHPITAVHEAIAWAAGIECGSEIEPMITKTHEMMLRSGRIDPLNPPRIKTN